MSSRNSRTARSGKIADRLAAARQYRFVGRESELELFRSSLDQPEPPYSVLFVHGPGGLGKTTLLREYERIAAEFDVPAMWLDGRVTEASPPGFLMSLASAMGLSGERSPLDDLDADWRGVLFIDTFELLTPLEGWLRDVFLPQMPAHSLVVIAGRTPPSADWRAEPGWSELIRVLPLRNLGPDEIQRFLSTRDVPDDKLQSVLDLTYGHPLALSLLTDIVKQQAEFELGDLSDHPDIIRTLVEQFVRGVPSARHRQAIDVCAHARVTSEALLASVFGDRAGPGLFDWLCDLSFIETGTEGIYPHDLARDVLEADLRWRDENAFRQVHLQIRNHIVERLRRSEGREQQRAFFDILFLHRHNPFMKPYYDWKALGTAYAEPATSEDHPEIIKIVRNSLGRDSARIAEYWLKRSPESFIAFRTTSQELLGIGCVLTLGDFREEDVEFDPAIRAAWRFVEANGPLRPGEVMMLTRFGMDIHGRQDNGQIANMLALAFTTYILTQPNLAWSFLVTPIPEFWHATWVYLNQFRSPEADYEVDGIHFAVYTHDWRAETALEWLETMGHRETDTELRLESLESARPAPIVVLSESAFRDAVRQALRDFTRPGSLRKNPLMRSRLIAGDTHEHDDSGELQALIQQAAETLRGNPREERFYRAIHRTYFEPAPSQEAAAEALDLPFSTYRYHLGKGIERITECLWERELDPGSHAPES